MKKNFIFLFVVLLTTFMSAQEQGKEAVYIAPKNVMSGIQTSEGITQLRNVKGVIWVQDSSYHYYYYQDTVTPDYTTKYIVLERDIYGNAITGVTQELDTTNQTWSNLDSSFYDYFNSKDLHTAITYPWNKQTLQWADTSFYREYMEDGILINYIDRFWDLSTNSFDLFGYKNVNYIDAEGRVYEAVSFNWSTSDLKWYKTQKNCYTAFDDNDKVLQEIILDRDTAANVWDTAYQYIFTYDSTFMKQVLFQRWADTGWVNFTLTIFSYDESWNQTVYLSQNWQDTAWVNSTIANFTYDENGNRLESVYQRWSDSCWVNQTRYVYTYDGNGNLLTYLQQNWQDTVWKNFQKEIKSYDDSQNLTEHLFLYWQDTVWLETQLNKFIYDEHGNKIKFLKYFNYSGGEWYKGEEYDYYWSEFNAAENLKLTEADNIRIYPNPTSDILHITNIENGNVTVFSSTGKVVLKTNLQTNQIDVSSLPAGSYILRIDTQDNNVSLNFIKK